VTFEIEAWLPETILLCPDSEAEAVKAVTRCKGRVWTYSEVAELRKRGYSVQEARSVAEARMLLDASQMWCKGTPAQVQKAMTF
jgi:hypothetical protein